MRPARLLYLSTYGDPANMACSSGAMHFFLKASRRIGIELRTIALPVTSECRISELFWALGKIIALSKPLGRRPRGYQFTESFLEAKWGRRLSNIPESSLLVYHYQLLPRTTIARAADGKLEIIPYIDMTLSELFRGQIGAAVPLELQSSAIKRELEGYRAASKIISFSQATKKELISRYGLCSDKIFVVPPGANLVADTCIFSNLKEKTTETFLIGFIGMDYRRKGLLPLIEAAGNLVKKGFDVRVHVIGPVAREITKPWVRLLGRVDKITAGKRFVEEVAACDVGVLASSLEGLPISVLEFRRLGVPVIATSVNGIPDVVDNEVGILLPPDFKVKDLEAAIRGLLDNPDTLKSKTRAAVSRREEVTWQRSASRFWSIVFPNELEC